MKINELKKKRDSINAQIAELESKDPLDLFLENIKTDREKNIVHILYEIFFDLNEVEGIFNSIRGDRGEYLAYTWDEEGPEFFVLTKKQVIAMIEDAATRDYKEAFSLIVYKIDTGKEADWKVKVTLK